MDNMFVKDENGKPIFLGKEDSSNPPVKPPSGSKIECSVCHTQVDYLLGENTSDGGVQGCEGCWKPSSKKPEADAPVDNSKVIL